MRKRQSSVTVLANRRNVCWIVWHTLRCLRGKKQIREFYFKCEENGCIRTVTKLKIYVDKLVWNWKKKLKIKRFSVAKSMKSVTSLNGDLRLIYRIHGLCNNCNFIYDEKINWGWRNFNQWKVKKMNFILMTVLKLSNWLKYILN